MVATAINWGFAAEPETPTLAQGKWVGVWHSKWATGKSGGQAFLIVLGEHPDVKRKNLPPGSYVMGELWLENCGGFGGDNPVPVKIEVCDRHRGGGIKIEGEVPGLRFGWPALSMYRSTSRFTEFDLTTNAGQTIEIIQTPIVKRGFVLELKSPQ